MYIIHRHLYISWTKVDESDQEMVAAQTWAPASPVASLRHLCSLLDTKRYTTFNICLSFCKCGLSNNILYCV